MTGLKTFQKNLGCCFNCLMCMKMINNIDGHYSLRHQISGRKAFFTCIEMCLITKL